MSNLTLRITSGLTLAALSLFSLYWSYSLRWAFMSAILCLGAWETARIFEAKFTPQNFKWAPLFTLLLVFAFTLIYSPYGPPPIPHYLHILTGIAVLGFTLLGFSFLPIENMGPWIFGLTGTTLFFGLWASDVYHLVNHAVGLSGFKLLLFVAFCMVSADTGAYFAGRNMGKKPLSPRISPKKTLEGLYGGIGLTLVMGFALGPNLTGFSRFSSVVLALIMSITAVTGDLFFSALKRFGSIKDSSRLIPGHGGVVDRFDSLFFSAPIAALYYNLFSH